MAKMRQACLAKDRAGQNMNKAGLPALSLHPLAVPTSFSGLLPEALPDAVRQVG
jgi:hypothetical protein